MPQQSRLDLLRPSRVRYIDIMPKRKASSIDLHVANGGVPALKRRASSRIASTAVNPDINPAILDAPDATRASPDSDINKDIVPNGNVKTNGIKEESPLSDAPDVVVPPKPRPAKGRGKKATVDEAGKDLHEAEEVVSVVVDAAETKAPVAKKGREKQIKDGGGAAEAPGKTAPAKKGRKSTDDDVEARDPEADGDEEAPDEEEVKEALARPPPVNSDYLPLPWKGRLGYACLNTYLRQSNPPVFSSRTCRIQSILEHRHPLQDPSQPEHPTKNKPDRSKPADVELGQRYVEQLCLANIKDIAKMLRWNDRYNIKFMRLSSEMFPFASHPEYGYKLAPFATEALAEAGKVIAELGHRVTTHPGQFTQLGSPRKQVIDNAIRDLEYHDEMLSLLKLPEQLDKDAVMILHMGGMFEGKAETIARFKENYPNLSQSIKNRLVLENDDMGWSVHDLLPVCEELNIPLVLDYHHHNIVFDSSQIREGTKDIMDLYPRIKATWDRKGIKQKMHYSEPTPPAITPRQRRKHSPRIMTLPPCAPDMDLMIEAKDKEQAVFELMRTFKLPGFDTFNDIIPYVREDDNKAAMATLAKNSRKKNPDLEQAGPDLIPEDEVGMGGPEGRVYWPPGMEEWLRPKKREVKPKAPKSEKTKEEKKAEAEKLYREAQAKKVVKEEEGDGESSSGGEAVTPATKKARAAMKKKEQADKVKAAAKAEVDEAKRVLKAEKGASKGKGGRKTKVKKEKEEVAVPTPSTSEDAMSDVQMSEAEAPVTPTARRAGSRKTTGRAAKAKKISYADEDGGEMEA